MFDIFTVVGNIDSERPGVKTTVGVGYETVECGDLSAVDDLSNVDDKLLLRRRIEQR